MLKTKIKASAITNLTDARYFAAWDIEWLGFSLDPASDYYTSPQIIQAIRAWVEGPKIVGEFGLATISEIQEAVQLLQLDAIQVGMLSDKAFLQQLELKIPIIKEIVIEKEEDAIECIRQQILSYHSDVHHFLLNFEKNSISYEQLMPTTRRYLREINADYPIILAINYPKDSFNQLMDEIQPTGLQLKGGEEEKVGYKSFDELDDIFEMLEIQL